MISNSKQPLVMETVAGLDIGTGCVKGLASVNGADPINIDFLSGTALQTNSQNLETPLDEAGGLIDDIFNNLEASFDSPSVENKTPRLFGDRGVTSGLSMNEFDTSGLSRKTSQDLSYVLVLGCFAGCALKAYWAEHHDIPGDVLRVRCPMLAVALPISEYKADRRVYMGNLLGASHMVSIYNFETTVRVEVVIEDMRVLAEGALALFAISAKGVPLMDAMLKDLREHGEDLDGITAQDILGAKNTLGIDIGEGAVNFPLLREGEFHSELSYSYNRGYGQVLDDSLVKFRSMNIPFKDRTALVLTLNSPIGPLARKRRARIQEVVEEETKGFVDQVINEFKKVLSKIDSYVGVIYVYGGGAAPVKDFLYPKLIEATKSLGGDDVNVTILYLRPEYSRCLNREGLFMTAQQVHADNLKKRDQENAKVAAVKK